VRPTLERLGNYLPAAIALALPTLFIPNAVDSFILPRAAIAIVGAGIGCGLALLLPGRATLGALRLPLIAAAAAAVFAFAFSISWPLSLSGAYTRYESLPIRLSYLALLAMPVWLVRDRLSRTTVEAAFVLGTSVASLEAIIQAASGVNFRPDGNIGNANLLGALIAMAIPLAVARGFRGGRFVLAWWLGVALMVGGLVTSTSRSGGLGAVAGCLALVVFAVRSRRWIAITTAGSTIVVGVALWAIVFGPLGFLNNDPARTRLQLWPDALRMIAARPLTGWGEDATGLSFGRFLSADWAPGVIYDRTHSGLLEIAATQGIAGVLALGWVLFVLFRGTWRYRFTESVGALGAACVGYTIWVIFNFDWVPATAAFWFLAGTAWSAIRAAETASQTLPSTEQRAGAVGATARSAGALSLVVAAVFFGVMPVLADTWYSQGRPQLAVAVDPLQARYHWDLGLNRIALGDQRGGVVELRRAADFGETEPQLYIDLGDAELKLGDRASAGRDYNRALLIDPYFAPAHQRLKALG